MIIPPGRMLDNFSTLNVGPIWDDDAGKKFLTRRLGDGANTDGGVGPGFHPRSDSGRLQNIVHFLSDIKNSLQDMNTRWWASDNAEIDPPRAPVAPRDASCGSVPHWAMERLTRTGTGSRPRSCLLRSRTSLYSLSRYWRGIPSRNIQAVQERSLTQALMRAQVLMRAQTRAPPQSQADYETRARIRAQAADSSDMVKRALGPVLQSLGLEAVEEAVEMPPLQGDTSLPHILVQAVPDTAATTVRPDDAPVPEHAAPAQKLPPPGQVEAIPSLPYSMASSSASGQADAVRSGDSPV
ncbi:hypothetical protein EDB85DRAFT_2031781 [Lactarius pseudohatsudake]|nr:hypothetical protein EDB85DRAFT_2031781 [Lactarius pseudohatsudake]